MREEYIMCISRDSQIQNCLRENLKYIGLNLCIEPTIEKAGERIVLMPSCSLILAQYKHFAKEIFGFCSFVRSCYARTIMMVLMAKTRTRIEGQLFDRGADDVITGYQLSCKLLIKRILAHLREGNLSSHKNDKIRLGGTVIDFNLREVLRNGNCYKLRGLQADLLKYFIDNPDRIISREELQESPIWTDSICTPAKEGGKTFDVNMSKLRKIIEPDPSKPQIIQSVRGIGWKLAINPVYIDEPIHVEAC